MIIIIEGPDRVGKSTLIENLKKKFSPDYSVFTFHFSKVYGKSNEEIQRNSKRKYTAFFNVLKLINTEDRVILLDRSHLGEMVYSPLYRNYSGEYVLDLEKDIPDAFLILLSNSPEELIKRDDGLSFSTDLEQKTREISFFKDSFNKSSIKRKILIETFSKNTKEVFEEALNFIELNRE